MKDARISGYLDTKYMTVLWIEQILHNFEDKKFGNFFNLEQINFCVTLVVCAWFCGVQKPYFDELDALYMYLCPSKNCQSFQWWSKEIYASDNGWINGEVVYACN